MIFPTILFKLSYGPDIIQDSNFIPFKNIVLSISISSPYVSVKLQFLFRHCFETSEKK